MRWRRWLGGYALALAIALVVTTVWINNKPLTPSTQVPTKNGSTFCDMVPINVEHPCLVKPTRSVTHWSMLLNDDVKAKLRAKYSPRQYAQLMSYEDMAKGIWFGTEFLFFGPVPYGVRYKVVVQPGTTAQEADWIAANGNNLQVGLIMLITAVCSIANPVVGAACGIVTAFEWRALALIITAAKAIRRCYEISVDTAIAGPLAVIGWKVQQYGQGSHYVYVLEFINGQWDYVKVWMFTTDHCKTHDPPPGTV